MCLGLACCCPASFCLKCRSLTARVCRYFEKKKKEQQSRERERTLNASQSASALPAAPTMTHLGGGFKMVASPASVHPPGPLTFAP